MKINTTQNMDTMVLNANEMTQKERLGKNGAGVQENGSIKASDLHLLQDDIFNKRQKAKQEAMDIIMNQFGSDGKIDDNLRERRDTITKKKEEVNEAWEDMNRLTEQQKKIQEEYGVADDSEEQKNLELYMKYMKSQKPGSSVTLTKEEREQAKEIESSLTEYQESMVGLEKIKEHRQEEYDDAMKVISFETYAIRSIKQEMLKYHGMDDATKAAEEVLAAANKEMVGMLMQEAIEHVDKELEEKVEQAKEDQAEKEEIEKLQEERKAEQKESQKQLEGLPETQLDQRVLEENLKQILEKQKLLEEDIKGLAVDLSR